MPHQFEPQTEPQTRPHTPQTIAPSATTPVSSVVLEPRGASETLSTPETLVQRSQEQTLAPAVSENWQTLLLEWKRESRWRLRHYLPFLSLIITVISIPATVVAESLQPSNSVIVKIALIAWLIFWLVAAGAQFNKAAGCTPKQKQILDQLAEVEDVNAAGPILEAWQASALNGRGRAEFKKVLLRLLPQLRSEDGANLTPAQRRILYENLSHTRLLYHPEITLACLDAIEQIGDRDALPPLARLIVHDAPTQTEQRVRERAQQCLTHLTQTLDFGTTAGIPGWIAKLPYGSSTANTPTLPAGSDEALIALFALIQLLPQMQPSDAGLLKASEREYMVESWRWMMFALFGTLAVNAQQSRLGSAFSFAALAALEQIGTGRELGLSHWLLRDVPNEDLPQLRATARRVNAILEQRRDKEQISYTLLRGSTAPVAAPAELLRPAMGEQGHSDPKELLRPDEGRN